MTHTIFVSLKIEVDHLSDKLVDQLAVDLQEALLDTVVNHASGTPVSIGKAESRAEIESV